MVVIANDGRSALLNRTCRSAMSVVAAFALAGCAEPSPEPVSGSALPSPESVQQNAEDQSFKRNDGDYTANPKSSPSKPAKCVRGTDWPALKGRDDAFPVTGLRPDVTHYPLECNIESWRLGAELPSTGVTRSGAWANPQFESPDCDQRSDGDADADIACSPLAGVLTPDGSEVHKEDEDRLKLELNIFEGEEAGDVDLIWRGYSGAVIEWTIPFTH
jgi:hypothetical protein